jgi:hypothetical protein
MNRTLQVLLLLVLALLAGRARASCSDGLYNDDEQGIDCGGSEAGCPACSCGTDLARQADPPRLINSNLDLVADEIETGLAGDDLRVAFTLDSKVFTEETTEGGVTYAAPEIEFVDAASGSNAAIPACTFLRANYTVQAPPADPYPGCAAAVTVWLDHDFTTALRECGFQLLSDTVADADGATFSQYEGRVRVRTEERGDVIRGVVTKKLVEVGFSLVVQFPNEVSVSSGVVDVIGTVVEDAAVTHQVWNLAERELDLNLFTSVQYPYELVATGFALDFDPLGSNPPNSLDGYPAGLPDTDASGNSTLLDYFAAPSANTPASGTADFGTPQQLPPTQCAASSTGSVNADACNQNFHLRMIPSAFWCDVDFDLVLTLQVRCRPGLTDVACDTANLPASGRTVTVRFGVDSDNYCPRVVEVAELEGEIGLYEDGEWGAHLDEGGPTGSTGLADERQYPGWYPDAPRNPAGSNTDARWTQDAFVFGTTLHVETRVTAEAGTNLASSTVARIYMSSADTTDPEAADGTWQRLVYAHASSTGPVAGLRQSSLECADLAGAAAPITCPVAVSNNLLLNDMTAGTLAVAATNAGALSPAGAGSFGARLGRAWEGVSRMTIDVGTHTVRVPEGQDFAEPVKVWVDLIVTYRAADGQQELSVRRAVVSTTRQILDRVRQPRAPVAALEDAAAHPPTAPALASQTLPATAGIRAGPSSRLPVSGGAGGAGGGDEGAEAEESGILAAATGSTGLMAAGAAACLAVVAVAAVVVRRRRRSRHGNGGSAKQAAEAKNPAVTTETEMAQGTAGDVSV